MGHFAGGFVAAQKVRPGSPHELASFAWPMAVALAALDVAVVMLAAVAAYFARFGEVVPPGEYLSALLLGSLLTVGGAQIAGVYKQSPFASFGGLARPILLIWLAVTFCLIILAIVGEISAQYSTAWAIDWFVFSAAGFLVARVGLRWVSRCLSARGGVAIRVAIVGPQGRTAQIRRAGIRVRGPVVTWLRLRICPM